jgi:stringent starvation protein B
MAPTARLPPKKDVALALLEQASMYIHLDPRADSVHVPAWFKKQPQLVLQVGLNMAVPIPDLQVDEKGLSCTLSFNRQPFLCMIPWAAVFALVGEKGQAMVWAEDVPAEVAVQAQAQKPVEKPRGHLRSVPEEEGSSKAPREPASTADGPPPADAIAQRRAQKKSAKKPARPSKEATKPVSVGGGAGRPSTKAKPAAKNPIAPAVSATKKPGAQKSFPNAPSPALAVQKQPARQKPSLSPKQTEKVSPPRAGADGNKPKRELPPYLRVVK